VNIPPVWLNALGPEEELADSATWGSVPRGGDKSNPKGKKELAEDRKAATTS